MPARRYRLLCPISRALDHVGDRWTLLLLRDLHAGPARFGDLQSGLGLATNLLTDRLRSLEADGLIVRVESDYGVVLYALTESGRATDTLLFELARLGARFHPDADVAAPGNRRAAAVTLQVALQRVLADDVDITAQIELDGEPFTVAIAGGIVDVSAGAAPDPDVVLAAPYEAVIAVADGDLSFDEFATEHRQVLSGSPEALATFGALMQAAFAEIARV